jgi:hypothetical protein
MKLEIGDKIKWVSAAGKIDGKIDKIVLGLNAAGKLIPWLDITLTGRAQTVRLCATDDYLKQLKVEKLELVKV